MPTRRRWWEKCATGAVNQIIDGDVAGLFLVAPVSILAGVSTCGGRIAGPLLGLGPAVYAIYMCRLR